MCLHVRDNNEKLIMGAQLKLGIKPGTDKKQIKGQETSDAYIFKFHFYN